VVRGQLEQHAADRRDGRVPVADDRHHTGGAQVDGDGHRVDALRGVGDEPGLGQEDRVVRLQR
jgi:hypothetical protein